MKAYQVESIPKYKEFKYWFSQRNPFTWDVWDLSLSTPAQLKDVVVREDIRVHAGVPVNFPVSDKQQIESDFEVFKGRPEHAVGHEIAFDNMCAETYEELIIGCILSRYFTERTSDPDVFIPSAMKALEWLRGTDFYTAPASTVYHESYSGGLLTHTFKAYNRGLGLLNIDQFNRVSVVSYATCILCHDWCKIGLYEPYQKNVKNEATNTWSKELAFKRNQTGIPLGHGVASMFLASKFFKLTPAEALAIRWHQGVWNCCEAEFNELQKANEEHPLVHLIQFADQLAIVKY